MKTKGGSSWIYVSLLVLIASSPFLQTLGFKFLVYDDQTHIFNNPYLQSISFKNIAGIWSHPYFGMYIPVTYTFWLLISHLGGASPNTALFHASNLIFHLLNVVLTYKLLLFFLEDEISAWIGAILFGIHPVQVESVAWVSAFKDLGSSCFLLLSFLFYFQFQKLNLKKKPKCSSFGIGLLKSEEWERSKNWILSTLFFTLAILTKPNSTIAVLLMLVLNRLYFKFSWRKATQNLIFWIIPSFALIFTTIKEQHFDALQSELSFWIRPWIILDTYSFYLSKILFPLYLFPDYARTIRFIEENEVLFYSWIPSFCLILLAIYFHLKRKMNFALPIYLWAVSIFPISEILSFSFQKHSTVADRYLYLPMVFTALFVGTVAKNFKSHLEKKTLKLSLLFFLFALFFLSTTQATFWKNSMTLFGYAVENGPASPLILGNYGLALREQGDIQGSLKYFKKSIMVDPDYLESQNNLGATLYFLGNYSDSADHYRKLLERVKVDWSSGEVWPRIYSNYGAALTEIKAYSKAIQILDQALSYHRTDASALYNRARVSFLMGKFDDASQILQYAIRLYPNRIDFKEFLEDLKKVH